MCVEKRGAGVGARGGAEDGAAESEAGQECSPWGASLVHKSARKMALRRHSSQWEGMNLHPEQLWKSLVSRARDAPFPTPASGPTRSISNSTDNFPAFTHYHPKFPPSICSYFLTARFHTNSSILLFRKS